MTGSKESCLIKVTIYAYSGQVQWDILKEIYRYKLGNVWVSMCQNISKHWHVIVHSVKNLKATSFLRPEELIHVAAVWK